MDYMNCNRYHIQKSCSLNKHVSHRSYRKHYMGFIKILINGISVEVPVITRL